MMETIGPMVDQSGRRGPLVRVAHVAGGAAGGAVVGAAAGAVGALVGAGGEPTAPSALVVAAGLALVYDLATHGRRIGLARQTPMGWRHRFAPGAASFLYGVDLGTGLSTRIYFASYLVALLAAGLSGNVAVGALVGTAFGTARALVAVLVGRDAAGRPTLVDDLAERRWIVEALNALALVQFGVAISLL